jgi:PAS domain S-box-containing protein
MPRFPHLITFALLASHSGWSVAAADAASGAIGWPWLVATAGAATALTLLVQRWKGMRAGTQPTDDSASPDAPPTATGELPDLVFEVDLDGRYIACHQTPHSHLLVAPPERLLGRTIAQVLPADAANICMAALREAHELAYSIGRQYRLDLDGDEHWFELSVVRKTPRQSTAPRFSLLSRDISQRKCMEAALEKERATLRAFFRTLPQLAWMKDTEGRFVLCNPGVEQFFGASEEQILGKTDFDFVDTELAGFFQQMDMQVRALDTPQVNEEWITYANSGQRTLLETTKLAVRDDAGEVIGVIGVGHDITERRLTEDALRASEQRYRALVEQIQAGVVLHDASGLILMVNPLALKLLDLREDEIIGRMADDPQWRMYREDGQLATPDEYPFQRVMATGESVRNQEVGLRSRLTGEERWMLVNASPVHGPDGSIQQVIVTFLDMTRRKQAERDLLLLNAAVNASSDAAYIMDASGRFVYVNDAACNSLHYTRAELIGKSPTAIDASLPSENIDQLLRNLMRHGPSGQRLETMHRRRDGSSFPVEISASRIELGGSQYGLTLARDITERKRHEAALRESEQRYREVFENVSDSLYLIEVTPERRFLTLKVNPTFERNYGLAASQLVGRYVEELLTPNDAEEILGLYRRCVESGRVVESEFSITLPTGRRHFLCTLMPLRDASERIYRVAGISREITLRKRHDELNRRLAHLAELAPGFFFTYRLVDHRTGKGEFLYASLGIQDLLGLTPQQVLDDASLIYSRMLPGEERRVRKALMQSEQTMQPCVIEYRAAHTSRGTRWLELRTTPERTTGGAFLWHGLINDITERKAAEHKLSESYSLLQELTARSETTREEERKRIAREVHDELGQRLTALRLSLATLRLQQAGNQPELAEPLDRLIETVDGTIQVARHVTSSLRPSVLNMGLRTALEWLASEFHSYAGTPCFTDLDDGIGTLDETQATVAFRVAQESLTNVARHAEASRVTLRFRESAWGHLLEIIDDGKGFDPNLPHTRSLGLAGMRERGWMLGGELTIISNKGQGTTVRLRIPKCFNRPPQTADSEPLPDPTPPSHSF